MIHVLAMFFHVLWVHLHCVCTEDGLKDGMLCGMIVRDVLMSHERDVLAGLDNVLCTVFPLNCTVNGLNLGMLVGMFGSLGVMNVVVLTLDVVVDMFFRLFSIDFALKMACFVVCLLEVVQAMLWILRCMMLLQV